MDTYQCEGCDETVEIEKYEAFLGHNEAYEFNQCEKCFEKSLAE